MQEYDDAAFAEDEAEFSSYTYRIDAVRNLGRVLAVARVDIFDTATLDAVDSYLVNWRLHLPESKKEFITRDGQMDHMLFQAHMIAESCVHKPLFHAKEQTDKSPEAPSYCTSRAPLSTPLTAQPRRPSAPAWVPSPSPPTTTRPPRSTRSPRHTLPPPRPSKPSQAPTQQRPSHRHRRSARCSASPPRSTNTRPSSPAAPSWRPSCTWRTGRS